MPKVTLKTNASLSTLGFKFLKNVTREDIPYDVAVALMDRSDKFDVRISKEEHQQAAFGGGKPVNRELRIKMIASAITELDREDPEHFTPRGVPDARALTAILGWQVGSIERDDAFKMLQEPVHKPMARPDQTQAPSAAEKGDAKVADFKKPAKKSLADKIAEREDRRDARRAAPVAEEDEDDDSDLPPIDPENVDEAVDVSEHANGDEEQPEDGDETEGEGDETEDRGGGSSTKDATADDFLADAGEAGATDKQQEAVTVPAAKLGGPKNKGKTDKKGKLKLGPSRKTGGKLVLRGKAPEAPADAPAPAAEPVDPTKAGAQEV